MAVLEPNELFYKTFEPKLSNRFIMYVEGIPSYLVSASARPQTTFNVIDIHHINLLRRVKGKVQAYADITLNLYDPISPSGAQIVMEWVRLHHEAVTGRDGYAEVYKKDITLNLLDPVGAIIEEWILKGAFINNVDFGGLDWSSDDLRNISVTISYDYPILNF